MSVRILKGSKHEIAEWLAEIHGEISEAIVFVDEPAHDPGRPDEDIFAEMEPFTVKAGGADYSRESLYDRMQGE